ncbi:MAG: transglutaminase-like domain-containing protein [Candidatus Moraniibacteriota bacterium]
MNKYLKGFLKFFGALIVVALLGWYIGFLSQVSEVQPLSKTTSETGTNYPIRKFPELQDPKITDFKWNYRKRPYELKLTLYKSVYDFYRSGPKEYSYTGELPKNWEENYYGIFVQQNPVDHTIPDLTENLKILAAKNRLSEDQTVELVVSFVQSIPYDDARAARIEQNSQTDKPNYPYEALYDNKGVCSDKSFLLTAILREMGYGTTLFEYKDEKHIAVGIQCPIDKSNYSSGFCYAETTQPGHKIGIVPDLSADNNTALIKKELTAFDATNGQDQKAKKLSHPKVYQEKVGKLYNGILNTINTEKRIATLEQDLASLKQELVPFKSQIDDQGKKIDDYAKRMEALKKNKDYTAYNSQVADYNKQVNDYKQQAGAYNKKVALYNQKVNEYNKLIKEFYE